MTINDDMTQPERVKLHLQLLEYHQKLNKNLYKLLPCYVKNVTDTKILFFNKDGEVIINFLTDILYISNFNGKNFYTNFKNFDYLFIEYKIEENIIYFFNDNISKRDIPKYIQKVRAFLALLPN